LRRWARNLIDARVWDNEGTVETERLVVEDVV
jgi:hypothetical protein